jgi:ribonucleotide reductase beta subunit family protein with ferritin-like domain
MSSQNEPLLTDSDNKYTIFPIQHQDIWNAFMDHKRALWIAEDVDMSRDANDWKSLNDDEKHFIKYVLAFFAASDGIVMENLAQRFCNEIQIAEARSFYAMQMFIENEHSITYSKLIDTYITDRKEKMKMFNAIENLPAIRRKAEWAKKWIESTDSFATRLVAFATVEGIFFSGSFCCIYWLAERGVMKGLCKSNELIARDEGLHTSFACLLYSKYIRNKLDQETIRKIIAEAVDIEQEFVTESLPCSLLGMNASSMKQYIEFVANRLVKQLGHTPFFDTAKQPFAFMDRISLENRTNFFEERVTEYQKNANETAISRDDLTFDTDF